MKMSQQDPNKIVWAILDIVGYEGDRKAFVAEFNNLIFQKVFLELLSSLKSPDIEEIKGLVKETPIDANKIAVVFKKFYSSEQVKNKIEEVTKAFVSNYLLEINPLLSDKQKAQIMALVE